MGAYMSDYEGVGRMLCSPELQADMRRRAETMLAAALTDAPYDANDKDGDHYRDHFSVDSGVREGKSRRAFGRLSNDHPAALPIEFGTAHTPAHHTLTRALDAAKG